MNQASTSLGQPQNLHRHYNNLPPNTVADYSLEVHNPAANYMNDSQRTMPNMNVAMIAIDAGYQGNSAANTNLPNPNPLTLISFAASEASPSVFASSYSPEESRACSSSSLRSQSYSVKSNSSARSWITIPCQNPSAAPCHRSLHVCAMHKDSMYVFGGYDGSNRVNDFFEYNFKRKVWAQVTATGIPPTPRDRHVAVVYKDSFYVFAGFDGSSRVNDFTEFNFSTLDDFLHTGQLSSFRYTEMDFCCCCLWNTS
jgi:hypothetical protein